MWFLPVLLGIYSTSKIFLKKITLSGDFSKCSHSEQLWIWSETPDNNIWYTDLTITSGIQIWQSRIYTCHIWKIPVITVETCNIVFHCDPGAVVFVIAWWSDLQLPMQSVPITTKVVSLNPTPVIQHYVIKFVNDLPQVGCFLRVLRSPPPIKLTSTI